MAQTTLTDAEIDILINSHRPLLGGTIPEDIKERLGVTTVSGKYFLTDKPFVIETSEKIRDLGYTTSKYFLNKPGANGQIKGLNWNSEWNLTPNASFVEIVSHPYFVKALDCGQKRVVFNAGLPGTDLNRDDPDFSTARKDIYDLAVYLLKTYKSRDITFIIKNWEGDWVLRGTGVRSDVWMANDEAFRMRRIKNFVEWARIRQEAVTQARNDVQDTKAKIYYAIEVNLVMEAMRGITCLSNKLLPEVELDMVSWSSYDGMSDPRNLFQGIEYLRKQHRPTPYMKGEKYVFIGEAGIAEREVKYDISQRWDGFFGVIFALNVPVVINWELYCNEPVNSSEKDVFIKPSIEDELRGFWLIKPDGNMGITGIFWDKLLKNPGKKFPK